MKKTFQKTLIAAAAGVALMSAVGTANANSLLFPYFTTTTGAQSVLTLSNAGVSVAAATQNLHYVYNYGTACVHYDANGSMTANDVLSHSIAATTAGGFGKTASTDTSTPVYFPLAGQTGFLVVSSTTTASTDALRGSMAIVDPSTGLSVSYEGVDNVLATNGASEGDYSAITDSTFRLNSLPSAAVTTSFFGVVVGNMNAAIAAGANWGPKATFTTTGTGVWNNDEVLFSGVTTKAITCAGSFAATDLMTTAQQAAVGTNGSLVKATSTYTGAVAPALGTGTGVVVVEVQTVQAAVGAPFAGKGFLHRVSAGL